MLSLNVVGAKASRIMRRILQRWKCRFDRIRIERAWGWMGCEVCFGSSGNRCRVAVHCGSAKEITCRPPVAPRTPRFSRKAAAVDRAMRYLAKQRRHLIAELGA